MSLKILLPVLFLFFQQQVKHTGTAQVIEGNIVSERTNKPIARAYVYLVEGEEEAMTDANGYFRIETWKKFPVELTVKYLNQPALKVNVSDPSRRQLIRLKTP